MYFNTQTKLLAAVFSVALIAIALPNTAKAHCDTMDGPVIVAARQALDTGNINLALVWVQPGDEAAIRTAFEQARAARRNGGAEQDAAERQFFEAFVRIHRAGEGAAYTGIKPAGTPIDPGVRAADRSLETGSVSEVQQLLTSAVQSGLQNNFQTALKLRSYDPNDVAAGREYVKAYVTYTHFVEGLHQTVTKSAHHQHGAADNHSDQHAAHQGDAHGTAHGAGHVEGHDSHTGHSGHAAHLPWILAAVLGLGLIGETALLISRRRTSGA